MSLAARPWAAEILHFWFYRLRPQQRFARDDTVDRALRRRFARDWAALRHRPVHEFLGDPLTARAAVLLFDQVPRNLFRDDPRAFVSDPLARAIAKAALGKGWDRGLDKAGRQFLAMPLMHSESRADQQLSIAVYAALGDPSILRFARAHRAMIARFGRFPHRNAVLGRRSTAAEDRAVAAGNHW